MSTLLLSGCRVADKADLVDLLVEDGLVREIGTGLHGDVVLPVDGRVVLPAFADVHTHLDKVGTFWEDTAAVDDGSERLRWAAERMRELKRRRDADTIAQGAEQAVRALVRRGTTAIRTHVDVDTVIGLRGLEALLEVRQRVADIADLQICVLPTEPGWHHQGPGWELMRRALALDVDAVGGASGFVTDPERYIDTVLDMAVEFDLDVDLHVDESDDPTMLALEHLARRTIERDRIGRVAAGHCSTLSLAAPDDAARIIGLVAAAGITVTAMPLTNLYLLGGPAGPRGMTRVRDLLDGGARVACASDNMQDPFNPYGNGDLLQVAALAAVVGHLGSLEAQRQLVDAVTTIPRQAMGLATGLAPGRPAELVVLDTTEPDRLLADQPPRRWVVRRGRVVAADADQLVVTRLV